MFLDLGAGRRFALSLRGCLGWQDGGSGVKFRRVDDELAGMKAKVPRKCEEHQLECRLPSRETARVLAGCGA
jgi:hypothetical protein